jgi:hypothetical protein
MTGSAASSTSTRSPRKTTPGQINAPHRRRTTSPSRRSTISERIAGMTTAYRYFRDPRLLYSAIRALYGPRSEHLLYRDPMLATRGARAGRDRTSRVEAQPVPPARRGASPDTRCPTKRTWRHRHVLNPPGTTGNHGHRHAASSTGDPRFAGLYPLFQAVLRVPPPLKIVVSPVRVWVSPFLKMPARV